MAMEYSSVMPVRIWAALVSLVLISEAWAEELLLPRGSYWSFFTSGPPPANWYHTNFDDAEWPTGPAQLGYGDGDEETVLFANTDDAPITSYFRTSFVITNRALIRTATLRILADDAFVIYLNGVELVRRHLPDGLITASTVSQVNVESGETNFLQFGVSSGRLRSGTNILAVELHQHLAGQHDASFDAELLANVPLGRPQVSIVSPMDLTVVQSGPVTIAALTSDPDGHIVRVNYFTNGVLLGMSDREPFSLHWSNPPPGRYAITARAFDYLSLHGDSEPVHLQVGDAMTPPRVVRGPYLQSGSSTSMVVRWRADWPSDSVVRFGTNPASLLESALGDDGINHEVLLLGLKPDTKYHYSVGLASEVIGSGPDYYFRTAPTNSRATRIWIIGDSGTANVHAADVYASYRTLTATQHTDVWLMLGDNAYGEGSDSEYQRAVFDMYPELLRNTVLWPALGNHDAGDSPDGDTKPFRQIFTLPEQGGAGGVPSGSELYYSYDYANIHFVCLDSFVSDRSVHGAMLTWLREDLSATDKDWIIAYWHHPPYSWGGHNSDVEYFGIEMRERVNPILEEFGVDLVFSGHSHEYERSRLINGHYGYSWELEPWMILDGGSGSGADGPYRKPAGGLGSRRGTIYTVCGCSGEGGSANVEQHPVMARSLGGYGSMVLEVNELRLAAGFLRPTGEYEDQFVLDKTMSLARPEMTIRRATNGATISWPTAVPGYSLFQAATLTAGNWTMVTNSVVARGRRNRVDLPIGESNAFFQLRAVP